MAKTLHIAWLSLIALSIGATMLAIPTIGAHWPVTLNVAILILAWLKAKIILARYLGLAAAPRWRKGFNLGIGAVLMIILCLSLMPPLG